MNQQKSTQIISATPGWSVRPSGASPWAETPVIAWRINGATCDADPVTIAGVFLPKDFVLGGAWDLVSPNGAVVFSDGVRFRVGGE
jgi:hypothetical protein